MKTFLFPEFSSNNVFLIIKCVTFRLKKFLENKKSIQKNNSSAQRLLLSA